MLGLMMNVPLLIPSVLRHAATYHGDTEIVSRTVEGPIHRYTYADSWRRSAQLANALTSQGLKQGDRIGTLAWNGYRHIEIYYGVSGAGLICHTINPRLFPEQIAQIINHAGDRILFIDLTFVPLMETIADRLTTVETIIVMTDAAHMPASQKLPQLACYETLITGQPGIFDWPTLDENTASGMCYTSGTTGDPKGVVYSHRSSVLHAMAVCLPDVFALSAAATVMPVVPMFHVNAWGMPYAAPMAGAKLVLPGPKLDGASLHELIEQEGVTFTAGVPTIWLGLLDWMAANDKSFTTLRRMAVGGSALPPVMIERFQALGVEMLHAWGMTETSPVGLASMLKPKHAAFDKEQRLALQAKQGVPLYGMEFLVADDDGQPVARDGKSFGNMLVRGPWVCAGYFGLRDSSAHNLPGWFGTGDVVTMDEDGYVQIVDRTKDVIKSGGEWISSIDLENIALAHPVVREAAVVARADVRWGERPVLVVVTHDGATLSSAEVAAHFQGKIAKWWVPEDVLVVAELPHTATGKLLKTKIREMAEQALAAPAG